MTRFLTLLMVFACAKAPEKEAESAPETEAAAKIASNDTAEKTEQGSAFFDDKLALTIGDKALYLDKDKWVSAYDGLEEYNEISTFSNQCKRIDIKAEKEVHIHFSVSAAYNKYVFTPTDGADSFIYGLRRHNSMPGFYYSEDVDVVPLPKDGEPDNITRVVMLRYYGKAYDSEHNSKGVDIIVIVEGIHDLSDLDTPDILSRNKNVTVLSKYSDNICAYLQ